MYVEEHTVSLDTGSGTSATGYTDAVDGEIMAVRYEEDGSSPFTTADIAISGETTNVEILTQTGFSGASFQETPLQPAVLNSDGSALSGNDQRIPVAGERIKVAVTNAGNNEVGVVKIFVGG